jgi:Domain of unknown function (DUF4190)/Septum formation
VTQPPHEPDPNRPQDTPRSFPTYRPEAQEPSTTGWAAPGQPPPPYVQQPYGQSAGQQPYGQSAGRPPYGQASTTPPAGGQAAAGQPSYGPQPYGQPQYGPGQPPYGSSSAYGQYPAAYGYGYPESGGTNGLATAALATGIGGIFFGLAAPVAIGLGIAALVQLKKRQQSGRGMAIAGLVIGSLTTLGYLVLFGILIAIGVSSDDDYGAPDSSGPTTYVDELAVGDCFDDRGAEDEVVRRSCAAPHDGEIIAGVTLDDGPYPGNQGVDRAADKACSPEFGTYVGKSADDSELRLQWWTPTRDGWTNGDDRLVVCAAYGPDGDPLTGTVKGTKR